jgi:squalene synthase HpnC
MAAEAMPPADQGTVDDYDHFLLREKQHAENFPVVLRLLPRKARRDLAAVYDVARVIDDLGDESEGDRTALLLRFREDLRRTWQGERPEEPVLRGLLPTIRARSLELEPFDRLVLANLTDQQVTRYQTEADLLSYCELSANPIGRIVLAVFGVRSAEAERLSDLVCTALQLIEHTQDIAEDRRTGRVYVPQEDLARYGVGDTELDAATSSPALRELVAGQTLRALNLLVAGAALPSLLHGWARLAIAGYIAGGLATVDALRRANGEVLTGAPRPRRRDVLLHLLAMLVRPTGHVRAIRRKF